MPKAHEIYTFRFQGLVNLIILSLNLYFLSIHCCLYNKSYQNYGLFFSFRVSLAGLGYLKSIKCWNFKFLWFIFWILKIKYCYIKIFYFFLKFLEIFFMKIFGIFLEIFGNIFHEIFGFFLLKFLEILFMEIF